MHRRTLAIPLAALALGACGLAQEQALKAEYTPITTREAFLATVEGRTWDSDGIIVTFDEAGAIRGTIAGEPVGGTWSWQDGQFCSVFRVGDAGGEGCSEIRARPGEILVVPIGGWGRPYSYTEVPAS